MKAVIFAGGAGTRMWPLSRKNSPKQFEPLVNGKSTIQLQVGVISQKYAPEDIYISTGAEYVNIIRKQLPQIPADNIIGEPCRRDVGAAVAFIFGILAKQFPDEPVLIMWSDHFIKKPVEFMDAIMSSQEIIAKDPKKIIFIGHVPRFASENLGWIEYGDKVDVGVDANIHSFKSFKYKPDSETAARFFASGHHAWNLGYFMTTPAFMNHLFELHAPDVFIHTHAIAQAYGTDSFQSVLEAEYPQIPTVHVDNAIYEKLDGKESYVLTLDVGWSDIGAWEALKEALEESPEANVTHGQVLAKNTSDSIIYNYDANKLIVTLDLDDFVIVNTEDVLLVTKKSSVPKLSELVKSLKDTEFEKLT
ncbi:MAG: sugar phosphate nucleotidyltransferase [Microgenomates group bacterium]